MGAERYIRIHEPRISEDKIVVFDIAYSRQIKKYFSASKLYIEYEEDIGGLDPSILYIPAVSGVINVAWAIGADLYVEELDEIYLKSLNEIKPFMTHIFPDFSFSTKIDVEDIVSNKFSNQGYGLLFTGGIDSVTSYIKHKHEKPHLIKVWGAEVPFDDKKNWKRARKIVADFEQKERTKLHVIRTNIPRVLKKHVLYQQFGLDWWLDVNHGIVLTGLCAPLTCAAGIGTLYFASGDPILDARAKLWNFVFGKIAWAGVKISLDNYEVSRHLKIRYYLKDYLKDNSPIFLKVCNALPVSNCGKCEKCLRTITGLVVEGIDPNRCGFNSVDGRTLDFIRKSFTNKNLFARKWIVERNSDLYDKIAISNFWKDAQTHIPETLENDLQGSKEFLEWFKAFNISEYMENIQKDVRIPPHHFLYMLALTISYHMPESTQNAVKRLLDFFVRL